MDTFFVVTENELIFENRWKNVKKTQKNQLVKISVAKTRIKKS